MESVKVNKWRVILTKLRASSHILELEVGRWPRLNRVPINDRNCRARNKFEDEFQFLLERNLYNDLRTQYSKTCVKRPFSKRPKIDTNYRLSPLKVL